MKTTLTIAFALLLFFTALPAQAQSDKEAVYNAVLDYVEGVYNVQPERIERSVHPELRKLGIWRPEDKTEYREGTLPMTYEQLVELAGKWNADGWLPEDAPKEIEVYEVLDRTATAKLTALWGIDYFHLAKFDDGSWKIINVLWQSHPLEEAAAGSGQ